jgi:hypoxanthine-DNA glycosylase
MIEKIIHPFKPIFDKNSKILILGSIASIKSRELNFPYANPNNRFWKVLEILFNEKIIDYKIFLLKHNIALWDSIKSCDITGSSDSSIKNIEINEIWEITKNCQIKAVFTNGKTSYNVYMKYIYPKTKVKAIYLPSTSPANASKKLEDLVEDYKIILDYLV